MTPDVRHEDMPEGLDHFYAAFLRIYPADFRKHFGREMVEAFRDSCRQIRKRDGRLSLAIYGVRAFAELVAHGVRERCARSKRAIGERMRGGTNRHGQSLCSILWRLPLFGTFVEDCQHAFRSLRKEPAFLAVAGITLALGLGANTAVFSVLNSVILNPLPYHEPARLVRIYSATKQDPAQTGYLSGYDFPYMRDQVTGFENVAVLFTYRETGKDLTGHGPPQRVRGLHVSSGYFETFGVTPLLGRTFARDEERQGARLAVLSHAFWRAYTNEDAAVVGRSIVVDGNAHTVIGVMRASFHDIVSGDVDLWLPQDLQEGGWNNAGNQYLTGIGRLAEGTTLAQAQAQVDAFQQRLTEESPDVYGDQTIRLVSLHDDAVGNSSSTLFLLWGAAGLVLLIACVNVANITFARSVARTREIAVRTALGSTQGRLVALILAESLMVAFIGGAAGTFMAYWGVEALLGISPQSLPRAEEISFDATLLGFCFAATVLTGLVFGAAPAIRAANVAPSETLRDGSRGNSESRRGRLVRSLLVAAQTALAFILLIGAGLLIRSFLALSNVDLGIEPANVFTFEVNLPGSRYPGGEDRSQFHGQFLDRLSAHHTIDAVGATSYLPANGRYHSWSFGYDPGAGERDRVLAQVRTVEGDFFEALGVRLLRGRVFDSVDRLDTDRVALVNERLARLAFGDENPIGKLLRTGSGTYTVVGVVENVSHLASGVFDHRVYLSHQQMSEDRNWALTYVVRTIAFDGRDIVDIARRELSQIDPALVLHNPRALLDVVGEQRARDRFVLALMVIFACTAVSLAAVGMYGVLAYSVNQRVHEIGVRMALGARPAQVRGSVIAHSAFVVAIGMTVGIAGALGFSRLLHSMLFGVSGTDVTVFVGVPLILIAVAAIATVIPVHRATRVNPVSALAAE